MGAILTMSSKSLGRQPLDHRVKGAITIIRKNFRQELTLSQIAKSVNLSPLRLRHLFKSETGVTPAQYIKSLRIREAKKLAERTFLNVK